MLVADRKSTTSCFMSTGPAWHETMDRLAVKRWPSLREIRISSMLAMKPMPLRFDGGGFISSRITGKQLVITPS
jgi:hypothetical protein